MLFITLNNGACMQSNIIGIFELINNPNLEQNWKLKQNIVEVQVFYKAALFSTVQSITCD
jgi:hypothetical protein